MIHGSSAGLPLGLTCGVAGCVAKKTLVDLLTALPPAFVMIASP
jgi:hypothetical protein